MMKKALALICCLCVVFAGIGSLGCGRDYLKLPEEPTVFYPYTYDTSADGSQNYEALAYNNRPYVVYGTLKNSMKLNEVVESVLGYRYNENVPDDRGELVIKLNGTDDYLMIYFVDAFMQPPVFYRAMDTAGQDIYTPDYIESYGDELWN